MLSLSLKEKIRDTFENGNGRKGIETSVLPVVDSITTPLLFIISEKMRLANKGSLLPTYIRPLAVGLGGARIEPEAFYGSIPNV